MTDTADLLARAIGAGYEIGEMIGRGGFGEVYAAADRSLNRTVAIKVLRSDVADSRSATDRFRREAEALGRLRHPHIMPVYGIGHGEGITYFVMPRIEGENLAAVMARGERLPLVEACRVIAETADALGAAHRAGVVHRDIKPDNILLEGVERTALLMDFGIAKSSGADARLTGTGMIVGTPFYMSPEQATGDQTGPASDIYSLGVVAYELLAGRAIFGQATSPQAVITAHLTRAPEDLRAVNPSIPAPIARAVMKCLRKEAADRWASVDEFRKTFGEARADLPRDPEIAIPEAPPLLAGRARLVVAGLGAAGALAAVIVFAGFVRPDLDAPGLPRETARVKAESLLGALGAPAYHRNAWMFVRDGSEIRYLGHHAGGAPDPAKLSRVPLSGWRFAFYTPGEAGFARVTVGGAGWYRDYTRTLDTTKVAASAVAPTPARIAATLRALGWDPDSLRLIDSARTGSDRVRWTWGWALSAIAGGSGADSVTRRVELTFTGNDLTSYHATLRLPASEVSRGERRSRVTTVVITISMVVLLIGIAADLVRARRSRALRLERALRIGIVMALLLAVSLSVSINANTGPFATDFRPEESQFISTILARLLLSLVFGSFVFMGMTALAAAAESLALRRGPASLAGYQSLMAPALRRVAVLLPVPVALGIALASLALVLGAVVSWLGGTAIFADQSWTDPLLPSLSQLVGLICFAPMTVFLITWVLAHVRAIGTGRLHGLGAMLIAVLGAAFAIAVRSEPPDVVLYLVAGGGLALMVARRGVAEAMIAQITLSLVVAVGTVWRAPETNRWPVTIALALLIASAIAAALFVPRPVSATPSPAGTPNPTPPVYSPAANTVPVGTPGN